MNKETAYCSGCGHQVKLVITDAPPHDGQANLPDGAEVVCLDFHEECSAVFGRFFIDSLYDSASARRNLVFGPFTLTTGCRPIVFVTTPPHPASNARMMFASDSVGGADDSMNGLSNLSPVKTVDRSGMVSPLWEVVSVHRALAFGLWPLAFSL